MDSNEVIKNLVYVKPDHNGMTECPYSGARVSWMCLRFCKSCIQSTVPKELRNIKLKIK